MPNPLYQQLTGQQQGMTFANPMQKVNYILNAMTNPAQFVRQQFPDIPAEIANNPLQVLQYIQQTRGISNQQIQQLIGRFCR